MNRNFFQILKQKRKITIILVMVPIFFWFLSLAFTGAISGLKIFCEKYSLDQSHGLNALLLLPQDNFSDRVPISNLSLPITRESNPRLNHERFDLLILGLIEVTKPGGYLVGTESDDGSCIWIDGEKVIDNEGLHSRETKKAFVRLTGGIHFLKISFNNLMGDAFLDFFWIPPNEGQRSIPILKVKPKSIGLFTLVNYFYWASVICFKIAQYWTLFFLPVLLYYFLFIRGPMSSGGDGAG